MILFLQMLGTAIGPKNACDYADVAISMIDDLVFRIIAEGGPPIIPILWARFRDDVYLPWIGTLEELDMFVKWVNNIHPSIQFTYSTPSTAGTEYLNMFVYTDENGLIQTKSHSKPCDTHAFLVPTSCHPTHQIENIPYSIANKVYSVCSTDHDYNVAKNDYIGYLKNRRYNEDLILDAFLKLETKKDVSNIAPSGEIDNQGKDPSPKDRLFPLVTDFNPALPKVAKTLKKYEHILDLDANIEKFIDKKNIFSSFRRAPTLQDLLIHSKLPLGKGNETLEVNNGCYKCEAKRCVICKNFLVEGKTFSSYHTQSIFSIKHNLSCTSRCVVYLINDKVCCKSNVGCTIDFKTRWQNHKSHIKKKRSTCEISTHFNNAEYDEVHKLDRSDQKSFDESLKKCLDVIIIEQVEVDPGDDNDEKLRKCKIREHYWQKELKCMAITGGFNKRQEPSIIT